MPTINQLIRHDREEKRGMDRTRASEQCPQKQGVCPRVSTRTPKKPNSVLRKIAMYGWAIDIIYLLTFRAKVIICWWGPSYTTCGGSCHCPKSSPEVLYSQESSSAGQKRAWSFGQWRLQFIRKLAQFYLACGAWSRRDNFLHACSPWSLGSKLSKKPYTPHLAIQMV